MPCQPVVVHHPEHFQAAHLVEPISGTNYHGDVWNILLDHPPGEPSDQKGVLILTFLHILRLFLCPQYDILLYPLRLDVPIIPFAQLCAYPPPPCSPLQSVPALSCIGRPT